MDMGIDKAGHQPGAVDVGDLDLERSVELRHLLADPGYLAGADQQMPQAERLGGINACIGDQFEHGS